ncbi:hypothetical protein LJC68_02085 [Bacteroidales bacterium OttesenSCG-928-B11]|nr:hypothetical protein [Bacteroidales bacterium OttesenSCG-928-C03]MDL2311650.1 hypothetical protein [Bacteroidales bacterium OttesenSCG-928-B11]
MKKILIGSFILIGIVCLVIFAFWFDNRNMQRVKIKVDYLVENGEYSVGSVTGKTTQTIRGGGTMLTSVMYEYQTIDAKYTNAIGAVTAEAISEKAHENYNFDINKGDKFLVVYDPTNPENSLLMLDKPIEKEGDFERCVKEMEQMRKGNITAN